MKYRVMVCATRDVHCQGEESVPFIVRGRARAAHPHIVDTIVLPPTKKVCEGQLSVALRKFNALTSQGQKITIMIYQRWHRIINLATAGLWPVQEVPKYAREELASEAQDAGRADDVV